MIDPRRLWPFSIIIDHRHNTTIEDISVAYHDVIRYR